MRDYGAAIEVERSDQEIPYPYVLEQGDDLGRNGVTAAELAASFPGAAAWPRWATRSPTASGTIRPGQPLPLALFDAVRVDYSLKRLQHYTGTDWRHVQPWILLTNYHRYVDQFVQLGRSSSWRTTSPYHMPATCPAAARSPAA